MLLAAALLSATTIVPIDYENGDRDVVIQIPAAEQVPVSATFKIEGLMVVLNSIENLDDDPEFNVFMESMASVEASLGGQVIEQSGAFIEADFGIVPAFDGISDGMGDSGRTVINAVLLESEPTVITDPRTLSMMTGLEGKTLPIDLHYEYLFRASGLGHGSYTWISPAGEAIVNMRISVTYEYSKAKR